MEPAGAAAVRSATPVRVDGEVLTQRPSQRKLDEARTKVLAGAEPSPSREAALIVRVAAPWPSVPQATPA